MSHASSSVSRGVSRVSHVSHARTSPPRGGVRALACAVVALVVCAQDGPFQTTSFYTTAPGSCSGTGVADPSANWVVRSLRGAGICLQVPGAESASSRDRCTREPTREAAHAHALGLLRDPGHDGSCAARRPLSPPRRTRPPLGPLAHPVGLLPPALPSLPASYEVNCAAADTGSGAVVFSSDAACAVPVATLPFTAASDCVALPAAASSPGAPFAAAFFDCAAASGAAVAPPPAGSAVVSYNADPACGAGFRSDYLVAAGAGSCAPAGAGHGIRVVCDGLTPAGTFGQFDSPVCAGAAASGGALGTPFADAGVCLPQAAGEPAVSVTCGVPPPASATPTPTPSFTPTRQPRSASASASGAPAAGVAGAATSGAPPRAAAAAALAAAAGAGAAAAALLLSRA